MNMISKFMARFRRKLNPSSSSMIPRNQNLAISTTLFSMKGLKSARGELFPNRPAKNDRLNVFYRTKTGRDALTLVQHLTLEFEHV